MGPDELTMGSFGGVVVCGVGVSITKIRCNNVAKSSIAITTGESRGILRLDDIHVFNGLQE